jgi:hypothetical protein
LGGSEIEILLCVFNARTHSPSLRFVCVPSVGDCFIIRYH